MTPAAPPYTINEIHLGDGHESTIRGSGNITNVNLYANRAEISRTYRFEVASGQNKVTIHGLTNALEKDSIRVEGRGEATIQEVAISRAVPASAPTSSPALKALDDENGNLNLSLRRCERTISGLNDYLKTLTVAQIVGKGADGATVLPLLDDYYAAAEKYEEKASSLRRELRRVTTAMEEETKRLKDSVTVNSSCLTEVTIGLFAEAEAKVELVLKYAVIGPSWTPQYDIRVTTNTKESPVELSYKAHIQQKTGEDWKDVPITLETTSPSFDLALPSIDTWKIDTYKPYVPPPGASLRGGAQLFSRSHRKGSKARFSSVEGAIDSESELDEAKEEGGAWRGGATPLVMPHSSTAVSTRGGVEMNATFRVPGVVSVPSDGVAKTVTIATLVPEAKLTWMAVPSIDTRVHLTAEIKNTSAYILLPGTSSVYVDGSFIAKSTLPLVSPQEPFKCALGPDPSVRIVHHPLAIKLSSSGPLSLSKTTTRSYTQRISVHNAKATMAVEELKVTSRIPVSENAQIQVKLVEPKGLTSSTKQISISDGIVANWLADTTQDLGVEGGDANITSRASIMTAHSSSRAGEAPADGYGADGKVQWTCRLDPQRRVELTLKWDVTHPKDLVVVGL